MRKKDRSKRRVAKQQPSLPRHRVKRRTVSLRKFRPADPDEIDLVVGGRDSHETLEASAPDDAEAESEEPKPTLSRLKAFVVKKAPPEKRDEDRLNLMLPKLIHDAVEMFAVRASVPGNTAAVFAVEWGLNRLHRLPHVHTILTLRRALAKAGADDGQFEWTYKAGSGTRERLDIRHVGSRNKARYMELKRGLQLQASTLGTLVLMAGLVDAPIAPGLAKPMLLELIEFQRRLRQQVRIIQSIYSEMESESPAPSPENQLSWTQQVLLK